MARFPAEKKRPSSDRKAKHLARSANYYLFDTLQIRISKNTIKKIPHAYNEDIKKKPSKKTWRRQTLMQIEPAFIMAAKNFARTFRIIIWIFFLSLISFSFIAVLLFFFREWLSLDVRIMVNLCFFLFFFEQFKFCVCDCARKKMLCVAVCIIYNTIWSVMWNWNCCYFAIWFSICMNGRHRWDLLYNVYFYFYSWQYYSLFKIEFIIFIISFRRKKYKIFIRYYFSKEVYICLVSKVNQTF